MEKHSYEAGLVNCACDDGSAHAPCVTCGAGKDAYHHINESQPNDLSIYAGDTADSTDSLG